MFQLPHRQPSDGAKVEFQQILDTDPKPLPCPVQMDSDARDTTDLSARRFSISMQLLDCRTCDCCGLTKPYHDDPTFPEDDECPFKRRHLVNGFQPAWKCTCDRCDGARYFGANRPKIITFYRRDHGGQAPWEFLRLNKDAPNALLCAKCYNEQSEKDELHSGQLHIILYLLIL